MLASHGWYPNAGTPGVNSGHQNSRWWYPDGIPVQNFKPQVTHTFSYNGSHGNHPISQLGAVSNMSTVRCKRITREWGGGG